VGFTSVLVKGVVGGRGGGIPIFWVQYVKEMFGDGLQVVTISCMHTI
jgi:hypothetical protein